MSHQNATLLRRAVEEIWNRGDYAAIDELIAVDYLGHASTPGDETHGREGYTRFYTSLREAFPDIAFAIEDQIVDGDRVVTRWTAHATHTGEFLGIPPTGRQGSVTGITIDRIANGMIVECWTNADELGLLHQLGVVPAPRQSGS